MKDKLSPEWRGVIAFAIAMGLFLSLAPLWTTPEEIRTSTQPQWKACYDSSNCVSVSTQSAGDARLDATGSLVITDGTSPSAGSGIFAVQDKRATWSTSLPASVHVFASPDQEANTATAMSLFEMSGRPTATLPSSAATGNRWVGLNMDYRANGFTNATAISGGVTAFRMIAGLGGDGNGVDTSVAGIETALDLAGQEYDVTNVQGLLIQAPTWTGASSTIDNYKGIEIANQNCGSETFDDASNACQAITIQAQSTNSTSDHGNLFFANADWDSGHLQMFDVHCWRNASSGLMRCSLGKPTADSSGAPIYAPPHSQSAFGGAFWGDSSNAALDTGSEVCGYAGLPNCKTTFYGSTTNTCATVWSGSFLALCYP